jgi:hypothetical protein
MGAVRATVVTDVVFGLLPAAVCFLRPAVLLQFTWEFWFAAAFYCYFTYMPTFLAANVPGMSRALALGSTMIHLLLVMLTAWVVGFFCDKGLPRMIVSACVYVVAAATLAPAALGMRYGGVPAAWFLHLWFSLLVGVIGGLLAVSMCPLYPPEVRTSGMNFGHQVSPTFFGVEVECQQLIHACQQIAGSPRGVFILQETAPLLFACSGPTALVTHRCADCLC